MGGTSDTPSERSLDEANLADDPFRLFGDWLAEAMEVEKPEPTAMALATADADGGPAVRMVLMRGFDDRGLVWFTNYQSRKAKELEHQGRAAVAFYWGDLERQVRVEGDVERITEEESDAYFASRALGSRLSAWASEQSEVIPDREYLERRVEDVVEQYGDSPPRPPHWGGYRLTPDYWEFWQGRESRLHDRIAYRPNAEGWERVRLAP